MKISFEINKIRGFDWDAGNSSKNKIKHKVDDKECEEVFTNQPIRIFDDQIHSKNEKRYGALGKTNRARKLVIFFTVRNNKIRIISARNQSQKDKKIYEEIEKQFRKEMGVKNK